MKVYLITALLIFNLPNLFAQTKWSVSNMDEWDTADGRHKQGCDIAVIEFNSIACLLVRKSNKSQAT